MPRALADLDVSPKRLELTVLDDGQVQYVFSDSLLPAGEQVVLSGVVHNPSGTDASARARVRPAIRDLVIRGLL